MRAIVLREHGGPDRLRLEEWLTPTPGVGEVVVRVRAAALNHRDIWIRRGQYASIRLPVILGSDAAGEVVAAGDPEGQSWLTREVVINPAFNWGSDPRVQSSAFHILGMPTDGTYAEFVKVPRANLYVKPAHLTIEEAAALPLASLTAYRAVVTRAELQRDEIAVVTGIGGGVALAALSIALHRGAKVYVTSGSEKKLATVITYGAAGGVNHQAADWPKRLLSLIGRQPDVVIDGAGGATFGAAVDLIKPGGRVVTYGATTGPVLSFEVRRLFWKQLDLRGTTMGTSDDFQQMIALYAAGRLRPMVDSIFALADAAAAHERIEQGAQFGKVVLRV